MTDTYFVILGKEDGGIDIQQMNQEELLERLRAREFGFRLPLDKLPAFFNYSDMVIIKGRIVEEVKK